MVSFKKLAKKAKTMGGGVDREQSPHHEFLLGESEEEAPSSPKTPNGFFAVYVGDEHRRFAVPTSYLSHPLFKMLLEKASNEFGFEQRERGWWFHAACPHSKRCWVLSRAAMGGLTLGNWWRSSYSAYMMKLPDVERTGFALER
ncbi:hypothetical protein NL676_016571 [Syzygium grande]|nr:hypothetical protein NL676_016571 [Syzygium grande]